MDLKDLQEEKETVRSLIEKSGTGLDNPMLVAIAGAAPSPTAADHYVTQTLGWPNEVGRVVRNMTRLHQTSLSDGAWKGLIESESRPADVLFKFNEMLRGLWFETEMRWGGKVTDRDSWPLLLREIKMADKTVPSTTYDGCGDASAWQVSELEEYDPLFDSRGAFHREHLGELELSVLVTAHQPTDWYCAYPGDSEKSFEICGKSVTLLPKPPERIFPEFWKVLCIRKDWRSDNPEELVVLIRRDFHGNKYVPILGEVNYRRVVDLGSVWDAVLKVSYSVDSAAFGLNLETKGVAPIYISCAEGTLSPNISSLRSDKAAEVVKDLGETLLKILYPPSLHEILGWELVENPPETLAELLMKK